MASSPPFAQGYALFKAGQLVAAAAAYERGLAIDPADMDCHIGLGIARTMLGDTAGAIAAYDAALAVQPDLEAMLNRALLLAKAGQFDAALAGYAEAAAFAPDVPDVHYNLGLVLSELGAADDAVAAFDRALALTPDHLPLVHARAVALTRASRLDAAIAGFDDVLAQEPTHVEALAMKGFTQIERGDFAGAVASFDRALAAAPDLPQIAEQRAWAQLQLADWSAEPVLRAAAASLATDPWRSAPPALIAMSDDPLAQAEANRRALVGAGLPEAPAFPPHPAGHRLRIAYASADVHGHATMYLLADVLEAHDRDRVEVTLLSYGPPIDDAWRARAMAAADHFIDVTALADGEVAALARQRQIDVAIDLKGLTARGRPGLFAARLAPCQVNWLGHPGTMALPGWDWLLADPVLIPAGSPGYSEAICRLPGSYQPASRRFPAPLPRLARGDHGLPPDGLVFAAFNQLWKVTSEQFGLWLRILDAVPASVLWLWTDSDGARSNLRDAARDAGINPDRLVFAPSVAQPDHLARLGLADLALDTFPCTGHTTAADALGMGVPLVTRAGASLPARVAASLVTAAGAADLIAADPEAYVALAVALAEDADRRAAIAARLAAAPSLHDPLTFARQLEAAFVAMDAHVRSGAPPTDIAIA